VFDKWDKEISEVTGDITYKATYKEVTNKYKVIFMDEDGKTILKEEAEYNYGTKASDIVKPSDPSKKATSQYTYTFTGWSPVIEDVTKDVVYKAIYKAEVNKYTVTWLNEDGTVLETDKNVEYGTMPKYDGETPKKDNTAQYTYVFDKWDKEISEVTGDITYKATYKLTVIDKETLQEKFVKNGFKIKNSFVHGFKFEESLINIKNKIGLDYTTTDDNKVIATGIQFKYNSEIFTAVVYGDLNGDGKINSADLLKMRQHLLGTSVLSGAYKEAGSIATGTTINSADLLRIRQHLLGQKLIEQ